MMRLRYPALVAAAWSSSAPLQGYNGTGISPYAFRQRVTENYEALSPGCPVLVRRSFAALRAASPAATAAAFRTCGSLTSSAVRNIEAAARNVLDGALA